ncbi:MAG: hypothetical protein KAR01_04225 [Desulfocapsa sp.]|nr:hypothetical protein [Desulfocapsa sp.]
MRFIKRLWPPLLLIVVFLCLTPEDSNSSEDAGLRFPILYNPNALAGRLYLQPLDVHDDTVSKGWRVALSTGSATDYNIYFKEAAEDEEWTVNSNIFSLALAKGISVSSKTVELGAVLRVSQDKKSTLLASLTDSYHGMFSSDGFGQTPPDDQYYGEVGNNNTPVIADSGDIFICTLQLSAKYQLWKDEGLNTSQPNVTLKVSSRIPLSGNDFDKPGIALSAGLSKEVWRQFYLLGAAGVIYQDLSQEDFNADNLDVEKIAFDGFVGSIWDPGKKNDVYFQLGTRWSSKRISYSENSESAEASLNVLFGINYRIIKENGTVVDLFLNFTEDIPGLGHGLEPDFGTYAGFSIQI